MGSAKDSPDTIPGEDDRPLRRRAPAAIPDADELRRFADLLNGDMLVAPPPAADLVRWTPVLPEAVTSPADVDVADAGAADEREVLAQAVDDE
jgi:hypothetical protein